VGADERRTLARARYTETDGAVSLSITGQDAKSQDKPNFSSFEDSDIRLREVLYVNDDLICYEWNSDRKEVEAGEFNSPEDIVQNFFEDIFLKNAGLA
jgi:hypothetical protein